MVFPVMRAVCYKAIEKSSKWETGVEAKGVERRDGKYRCAVNDIVSQGGSLECNQQQY